MQNNYETYSPEQFLDDPFFIEWVKRPVPETEAFWQAWKAGGPENLKAFQEAELQLRTILSAVRIEPEEGDQFEVWQQIDHSVHERTKVVHIRRFKYWLSAAAVILFLGFGTWFLMNNKDDSTEIVQQKTEDDILPGGNKAVLTLADGTRVILDATDTGAISEQGGVTVIKLDDGELSYQKNKSANEAVVYNTISTPRGGQYQLTLSDGTKVWLNAESSLRYPTAFTGSDRKVELTGEGYFEVAHNAEKPFKVEAGGMDVKVLGTSFNINAYVDENVSKATLIQGFVAVKSKLGESFVLQPGNQAVLQRSNNYFTKIELVNIEQVMAWKNGYFSFQNASLRDIMRQLSRWYDIEIEYEGVIAPKKYRGIVPRDSNLEDVLRILEESNVHFRVEGRVLKVQS